MSKQRLYCLDLNAVDRLVKRRGVSYREVSERAGMGKGWMGMVMLRVRGGRWVEKGTVRKLAKALRVSQRVIARVSCYY